MININEINSTILLVKASVRHLVAVLCLKMYYVFEISFSVSIYPM